MDYSGVCPGAGRRAAAVAEAAARYAEAQRRAIIIAGPNGAGKTTFARQFLPREGACFRFVNADEMAAGLSPFAPESAAVKAGKLMLGEIREHVRAGESFAVETTLAGRRCAKAIPRWQANGYGVKLVFLQLPSVELAVARVAARVAEGGHNVPEAAVRRRYEQGWRLFNDLYKSMVDAWALYDSSSPVPTLVDEGENS
jgi:predicted ABC-type ATPase